MSCYTVDELRYHTGYIVICLTDVVPYNLYKINEPFLILRNANTWQYFISLQISRFEKDFLVKKLYSKIT